MKRTKEKLLIKVEDLMPSPCNAGSSARRAGTRRRLRREAGQRGKRAPARSCRMSSGARSDACPQGESHDVGDLCARAAP